MCTVYRLEENTSGTIWKHLEALRYAELKKTDFITEYALIIHFKKATNGMYTASRLRENTSGPVQDHLCAQPGANLKIGFYCHMDISNTFRERQQLFLRLGGTLLLFPTLTT